MHISGGCFFVLDRLRMDFRSIGGRFLERASTSASGRLLPATRADWQNSAQTQLTRTAGSRRRPNAEVDRFEKQPFNV